MRDHTRPRAAHRKIPGKHLGKLTTRERIIKAASDLMEGRGYHGTGLDEIVRKGSAPKGSIYHHFPGGKEEIAAEAIALAGRNVAERIRVNVLKRRSAGEAIRAFVDRMAFIVAASGFRSGSPLTTVASETASNSKRLNRACREAYTLIREAVGEKLYDYGFQGPEATALSTFITAAVEGGLILSRTYHSRTHLRTVAKLLGVTFKAVDPASGRK